MGNLFSDEKYRTINYQEINSLLIYMKENAHSPYIDIEQKLNIKSDNLTFSDINLWLITTEKGRQEIPINSDGAIALPILSKTSAGEATLTINQEKEAVSISIDTGVSPVKNKEADYWDLFILLDDTNNFISEMGGAAAWFAPSMDALSFEFEQPATINISSKKKNYHYETDENFKIEVKVKRKLMKENPKVTFSDLPIDMYPVD